MPMSMQERIAQTVERNRAIWAALYSVLVIYTLIDQPLWVLAPIGLFGFVSYYAMLFFTALWMELLHSTQVDPQEQLNALTELNRRLAAGESGAEIERLKKLAGVDEEQTVRISDTVIGRYYDKDIYEWVDLTKNGVTTRFLFHDVAPRDQAGNFLMPRDGQTYLHISGVNYKEMT